MKTVLTFNLYETQTIYSSPYLTDREKQVFELYYMKGWKMEDIAQELYPYTTRQAVGRIIKSIRRKALEILLD